MRNAFNDAYATLFTDLHYKTYVAGTRLNSSNEYPQHMFS